MRMLRGTLANKTSGRKAFRPLVFYMNGDRIILNVKFICLLFLKDEKNKAAQKIL